MDHIELTLEEFKEYMTEFMNSLDDCGPMYVGAVIDTLLSFSGSFRYHVEARLKEKRNPHKARAVGQATGKPKKKTKPHLVVVR